MVALKQALKDLLPECRHEVLAWDFLPWDYIRDRHPDMAAKPLVALFDAYSLINTTLNLEEIVQQELPQGSWGCMRCGFCCSSMRPGPVRSATYRKWENTGAPVAWFYRPRRKERKNSLYRCWYHNGVRLRICPFMLVNRSDSKPICAIYHMGDDLRPPVCSRYVPMHETCTAKQLEIQPWESN